MISLSFGLFSAAAIELPRKTRDFGGWQPSLLGSVQWLFLQHEGYNEDLIEKGKSCSAI